MMKMENNANTLDGALFPVVFFDGEREIDLGTVLITPSMNFKGFQSLISQKIGISPHQITTYFTPVHHQSHRRRHPVTNKFNFAAALPESNSSFFWVVLKRSRRVRRRRPKLGYTASENEPFSSEMENFVLLRRNPNPVSYAGVGDPDYFDYLSRLKMMERVKERYLLSLNLNSNVYSDMSSYSWGNHHLGMSSDDGASSSGAGSESKVFCDVCLNARVEGETVPFHCCKNDAVTMVYRSPAGPIGPPARKNFY